MMSKGNKRANGVSERKSHSQPNCEHHRDIGHELIPQRRRHRPSRPLLAKIKPGKASTGDGPGTLGQLKIAVSKAR
jgi:hypothetical protein